MAIFFKDNYKKIHDALENASDMQGISTSLSEDMSTSHTKFKNISTAIDSSTWTELGKMQLSSELMGIISEQIGVLNQGISVLNEAVSEAMGNLLPKLKELKEKDEKLEEIKNLQDSLSAPSQYDKNGKVNPSYTTYVNSYNEYTKQINELNEALKNLTAECDGIINKINGLKPKKIEIKRPATGAGNNSQYVKSNQPNNYLLTHDMYVGRGDGRMLNYGEYSVVDTPFSLVNYFNYIQKNRVYQDGSDSTNACFSVAHFYAKSMLMNTTKSGALSSQLSATAGDVFYKDRRLHEPSQQAALKAIYEELKAGRPVSIDVRRKKPGGRHVVTVVGFKSNVKSAADLRAEDLLILDTWDGQIERMDTATSRVMAAGQEVGQGYQGYRVNRVGAAGIQQSEVVRAKAGMYA